MLSEPTYLASRIVAPGIERHFAIHLDNAREEGNKKYLATAPQANIIEAVIDAAFWASLLREEGKSPKISIALLQPQESEQPLVFGKRLRLTPRGLTKLAPAVESPGLHLGVWYDEDGLYVWGTTVMIPFICFVLEVVEPGLLVIKHSRIDGFGKFLNIAVLKGDQIKVIDETNSFMRDCPAMVNTLLGMPLPAYLNGSINVLVELATAMRAHGRGGLVLVVPNEGNAWEKSIIHPLGYPVSPAFTGITELMSQDEEERTKYFWQEAMRRAIDIVGGFTAVDGATIINRNYNLIAFGTKIARSEMSTPVDQIVTTEPVVGGIAQFIHPAQNGGTRHLAAAQFVYDQRDALALVASQDGHFTIFAWSEQMNMVHAHKIDILLL
jgi:hypothetical protein